VSGPTTIPEALFATAERGAGEFVFHLEQGQVRLSTPELAERAMRGARRLLARGVEPGDAVGVLGPNRPEWVVGAFATWLAGAVLVPIQIPLRVRDPDAFREQLRSLVAAGGCRLVLADQRLAALLPPEVAVSWVEEGDESSTVPPGAGPQDQAVIQFTSGSTSAPKGALIPHSAVMAQVRDVLHSYRYDDGTPRRVLNWAPFFHDLGLFGNVVQPAFSGATVHQLPTELFARDPAEWLRLVERTRAALTVGPSTAYGSALRAAERRGERPDLSSLELAYFAAEAVDPAVARQLLEGAAGFNLDPEALGSTYGLAEAVMAVSYSSADRGLHMERVRLDKVVEEGVAEPATDGDSARVLACCGPPLMGLRIAGQRAEELDERRIGEIQVRGPSLMSGYTGDDAPDPFVDGWLRTGDMGFLADGELYVTGRAKDMMISMGHNYYPEDFEWAAARVDGVKPGRCVAFSLPETEGIAVLVEAAAEGGNGRLEREVRRSVADAVGASPERVVVLPPGTVEKTTSGKLRRASMREAFLSGAFGG
jgi:acyl-CoA synthetase (AMP-forming)/AMP-acid ligase II